MRSMFSGCFCASQPIPAVIGTFDFFDFVSVDFGTSFRELDATGR